MGEPARTERVEVTLPAPSFRGVRHGRVVYVALPDVVRLLEEHAAAYDDAGAVADLGRAFRALADQVERSAEEPFR